MKQTLAEILAEEEISEHMILMLDILPESLAKDYAKWYLQKSKRNYQSEIDDVRYATVEDYLRHHDQDDDYTLKTDDN